jgi:hypothetical protein
MPGHGGSGGEGSAKTTIRKRSLLRVHTSVRRFTRNKKETAQTSNGRNHCSLLPVSQTIFVAQRKSCKHNNEVAQSRFIEKDFSI